MKKFLVHGDDERLIFLRMSLPRFITKFYLPPTQPFSHHPLNFIHDFHPAAQNTKRGGKTFLANIANTVETEKGGGRAKEERERQRERAKFAFHLMLI